MEKNNISKQNVYSKKIEDHNLYGNIEEGTHSHYDCPF